MAFDNDDSLLHEAAWIWLDSGERLPHQYLCFRKTFDCKDVAADASLDISADSDFVFYLNGEEVTRGQFSDYPEHKTYTRVPVASFLKPGGNTLAVLAYYRGENFSEHRAGRPGLIAALANGSSQVLTDRTWKGRPHLAFLSGPMPRVTPQMGFTTFFDARRDAEWISEGVDDSAWPAVAELARGAQGFWKTLFPRPVPPLRLEPDVPVELAMQGSFYRRDVPAGQTFAESMSKDALVAERFADVFTAAPIDHSVYASANYEPICLPSSEGLLLAVPDKGAQGRFVIVDLGREEVGLLSFDIKAPEGAVLDIGHGEHLDDGRVRAHIGGRNFADRYVCRAGWNHFVLPFRRLGARYIEVHFSAFDEPIKIHYIGLRPTPLAIADQGQFASPDFLAQKMYDVGKRTLHICMHEHYEDCPWREQALYAFDSRNQALYGYYAFGNYEFAAASFDLLGKGIREDGLLELCAPALAPVVIPIFSFSWITALAEYGLYSGDPKLFQKYHEQIGFMLGRVFDRYEEATGLYSLPEGKGIWNFYEWSEGLGGDLACVASQQKTDAPYNLFLLEALRSYAWMLSRNGDAQETAAIAARHDALAAAVYQNFWNPSEGLIGTHVKEEKKHFAELVQYLALHNGIVPESDVGRVVSQLIAQRLPFSTLSSKVYQFLAFNALESRLRTLLAGGVREEWGAMLLAGATTFWETSLGGDDFACAGSLCHGWSALPVYYLGSCTLGVRPLKPGFHEFSISPYPGNLSQASGGIPTPRGPIHIRWVREPDGLAVTATGPAGLTPKLVAYPEAPLSKVTWNGRDL